MVYVAWGNVVGEFVVEDGLEGGDDADAAYVEELEMMVSLRRVFGCVGLERRCTRAFGGAMVSILFSADAKLCFNGWCSHLCD